VPDVPKIAPIIETRGRHFHQNRGDFNTLSKATRRINRHKKPRRTNQPGFSAIAGEATAYRNLTDDGPQQSVAGALREDRISHTSHLVDTTNHLGAVAELVVVPHVQDQALAIGDGGLGIDDTGMA